MDDTRPLLPPPPAPEPVRPAAPPRRGAFAASVLAGALVVGGAAGVGGAAAWQEWSPRGADTATGTTPSATPVFDGNDPAAAPGSVEEVAAKVLPTVVKIDVTGPQGTGSGSGIILSADGEILTNNHVVETAAESGALSVAFADGSRAEAEIVGTDPLTDTAVIRAQGVTGLTPATLGESGDLGVGQQVVAVGSPFGLDATVTSGIVSALDRPVNVGTDSEGNSTTYPAIQTDAAINPGNSGGPLVDMNGDVVGINSSIRTASSGLAEEGGSIGLGFAIPMDEVMPIVEQMREGETPTHARLGITVSDVLGDPDAPQVDGEDTPAPAPVEGAQVQEVVPGSTADEAGLGEGDVITKIDETLIRGADSLVATVRSYRPGEEVTLTYVRDGEPDTVTLELDSD